MRSLAEFGHRLNQNLPGQILKPSGKLRE